MEVFLLITLLHVAAAEFAQDLVHVQAFIDEKRYVLKKKFRPLYHISSPVGWLNSPSGFTYYNQNFHIFYQYHPYNGAWGSMHWGQAISDNLVDWVHYPPAIMPKEFYDKHGCLSGSATIHNNFLTLFYTGNVQANNRSYQTQNIAISGDGIIFQKYLYNPVVRNPPPGVQEFRNPKVWRFRNKWYMMIGTSSNEGHGQLVIYTSSDMFNWKFNNTIARSFGDMGYMWEHPDFFEIDNQYILILSIQGLQGDSYRFKNAYQTGYVIGNFNYQTLGFENMEVSLATFDELDFGHDFYAAQTMPSLDGRRLLIAWLGMWESEFMELKDGWASMLTIVRELKLSSQGRLLMTPVREITDLRTEILENAWYSPGEAFHAGAKAFELVVNATTGSYDAAVIFEWDGERQYAISYNAERGQVTVDRGGVDGVRRADWVPDGQLYWRIFVDSSSIEVFCGDGEVVFSSRIYPRRSIRVRIDGESQLHIAQYKLRRSVGYDDKLRSYLKQNLLTKIAK
jgi:beta-fructofuranosidase